MPKLLIHQKEIQSMFELLGDAENDITYALGWCFANSRMLRSDFFHAVIEKSEVVTDSAEIMLQTYGQDRGFTDIEILTDSFFWIVEAKKGWKLPSREQLHRYENRFKQHPGLDHRLIVVSEHEAFTAKKKLKQYRLQAPAHFFSWRKVHEIIKKSQVRCRGLEKGYLNQLDLYYRKVISMQNKNSNEVFCVVVSNKKLARNFTFLDIVKKGYYSYPIRGKWPKTPPTYLAVRHRGKLRSIHYVKGYHIVERPDKYLPEIKDWTGWSKCPHYILELGKPFKPSHEVKNGRIFATQHIRCRLDALFTCETIQEARDQSRLSNKLA